MANNPTSSTEPTQDRLTAYLDGELSAEEGRALEQQLAKDDALRTQMQELDRIWNALDELPHPTVGDQFAKSTIEMATVEAEREVAATMAMPVYRRPMGRLVGMLALAAAAGFLLITSMINLPDRLLIRHLPVVLRADGLQQITHEGEDSVSFLRQLAEQTPLLLATVDADELQAQLVDWQQVDRDDTESRRSWVAALSGNKKARLIDAARRYRSLTDQRRKAMQQTHQQITASDDAEPLMQTALAYEAWLATQTASDQARLRQLPAEKRLAELTKIERQLQKQNRTQLSPEDAARLRQAMKAAAESDAVRKFVQSLSKQIEQNTRIRGAAERMAERFSRSPAQIILLLAQQASKGQNSKFRLLPREAVEALQSQASKVWESIEPELITALDTQSAERLRRLNDEKTRRLYLGKLIIAAARDAFESTDLEEFFASDLLSNDDRHRLLAMPPDEMKRSLRAIYLKQELGIEDFDDRRGGWQGRRDGRSDFGPADRDRDRDRGGTRDRSQRQRNPGENGVGRRGQREARSEESAPGRRRGPQ